MKKEAVILVLLFVGLVSAVNVDVSPDIVYGSTRTLLVFELNNLHKNSVVTTAEINVSPLIIHSAMEYAGWTLSSSSSSVSWSKGNLGSNVKSAVFEITVDAPLVATNISFNISVKINDKTFLIPFTIANDSSGPVISSISPGSVARNETVQVSVIAQDNETNVSFVEYSFGSCAGSTQTVNLSRSGDFFSGLADFSSFESLCYTFAAHNNVGETSLKTGALMLDGAAPNVTLLSPLSNITENAEFLFKVSDNIANVIPCTMNFENLSVDVNASNNSVINVSLTLASNGLQSWTVKCTDLVNFSSSQSQSILVDTSPPAISLESVPQVKRTNSLVLQATVTDSVGLSQVNAFADGNLLNISNSGAVYQANFTGMNLGRSVLNFVAVDLFNHSSNLSASILVIPNHNISFSLDKKGSSVSVQGSVAADGSLSNSTVLLKTSAGNFDLPLINSSFNHTINLSDGSHSLSVEYWENGANYIDQKTVQVGESSGSSSSSVARSENQKTGLAVASLHASPSAPASSPAPAAASPAVSAPASATAPAAPSAAYSSPSVSNTPRATGVFNLGGAIAWASIFFAVAVLALLVWYSRRKPKQGIDWSGYFDRHA